MDFEKVEKFPKFLKFFVTKWEKHRLTYEKKERKVKKTGYREVISNVFYEGIFVRDEYRKKSCCSRRNHTKYLCESNDYKK